MKLSELTDFKGTCEECPKYLNDCNGLALSIQDVDEVAKGDPQTALEIVEAAYGSPLALIAILAGNTESIIRKYNSLKNHYQALIQLEPQVPDNLSSKS